MFQWYLSYSEFDSNLHSEILAMKMIIDRVMIILSKFVLFLKVTSRDFVHIIVNTLMQGDMSLMKFSDFQTTELCN